MITINLEKARRKKLAEINSAYDKSVANLDLDPPKERESYSAQYTEAVQWRMNNSFPTPFIDGLLANRQIPGEDKAALAQKIINAATALSNSAGPLTGKRQRLETAIRAAQTVEELSAITWE